ncbi:MAG: ATP-binding protein [Bacteroidales bacterium]|nr:ATP-binding protein [Bacteroidales bacterium]
MAKKFFKRKIYNQLLKWKNESNGQTAILVEGARRIGKSTIVEAFAKNEYESYILIDFNKASQTVKQLFDDLMDLNYLFLSLQTIFHTTLVNRKSVIVFDEVQQCPQARQAIKYLVADGRYDYVETGSLISIKKNTENITIPSEEERVQMYPMDYEEFRWALGDESTLPAIRTYWENKMPLKAAFRTIQRDFRLYMLVGGMPQAVESYLESNDFNTVDAVKRKIIRLYEDDFFKIDSTGRITQLFRAIPSELSRSTSRYVPSTFISHTAYDKQSELMNVLEESKTVHFAYHTDDPNVGMGLTRNPDKYKIYVADTGLFVTMAFWEKSFTENVIYEKLLGDKLPTNLGYVYENVVAQMLRTAGNELYYHTWPKDEKHNYEIDFLLSRGSKLCPIEVKSSSYRSHKSLDEFCTKYSGRISRRYIIYTKDLYFTGDTAYIPAFMTMLL